MKALHAARMHRYLTSVDEAFTNMTSRAFVFSYFDLAPGHRRANSNLQESKGKRSRRKKSPMKQIFGKVKMDDYFPGGLKNLKLPQRKTEQQNDKKVTLDV